MRSNAIIYGAICLALPIMINACKKSDSTISGIALTFEKPENFPDPVYTFANNGLTNYRFNLGRDLFYAKELSLDNSISCASCHDQVHGFADHGVAFSAGVGGTLGTRNSPTLLNLAWQTNFMWDGGVNHLDIFPLAPITNVLEMKETIPGVLAKLNASADWKLKFKRAYGIDEITDQAMFRALGQFMAMMVSDGTKYDQVLRGEATFSPTEAAGYALFQANCTSCHKEPLLTDNSYRNNGLDDTFDDLGRELITLDPTDRGKFKVPTLRNVAITYPYMHDGRFYSLAQVLDHYSEGIHQSATLDPLLSNGISLTESEKAAMIAFLNTLNDYKLMNDHRFSEP